MKNFTRLSSCPFCGLMPALKGAIHDCLPFYQVSCTNTLCPANNGQQPQQTKEQAIERWQSRTK